MSLKYPFANFLGIGVDAITYDQVFSSIDEWIKNKEGRSHHIACINAYCVSLSLFNERLYEIYNGADIVGPDGIPFVRWIKKVIGCPCDRIAAPDTISKLAEHSKHTGYTFYLYGGSDDVVVKMKEYLEINYPHISIIGYYSPPFRELTSAEDEQICRKINEKKPDIICVGLGTPKQDYWIDEHLDKIRGSVMIASGATFDFFGGRVKMAPEFIRFSGFEWLYRLFSKDFKRLFKRYVIMHSVFIWYFILQMSGIHVRQVRRWLRE